MFRILNIYASVSNELSGNNGNDDIIDAVKFLSFFVVPIVILVLILILMPHLIDLVYTKDGDLMFKVYSRKSGIFLVKDYTRHFKRKIYFKSYVDVEAYISRRINGWNELDKSLMPDSE